ncbi:hypothetical protein A2U01_0058729 [Trifolium medium]|uniref:Uncharacterized protein n=1 Tax=Trifolium medium TaxID=97028 RepID=A0A392RPL7_9FABA|nr:hypothetical protein [Trifolium medium]
MRKSHAVKDGVLNNESKPVLVVACARHSYSCVRHNYATFEEFSLLFSACGAGRLRPAQLVWRPAQGALRPAQCRKEKWSFVGCWLRAVQQLLRAAQWI